MITCDTNVLVYAAKFHLKSAQGDVYSKSAHMLAMRRKKTLAVVDVSVGELLQGVGSEQERDFAIGLARRMTPIVTVAKDVFAGLRLAKLLSRKRKKALNDCLIYVASCREQVNYFASFDTGFVGDKNRIRVPEAASLLGLTPSLCLTPNEVVIMPHVNPRKKSEAEKQVDAHRRRAWARAQSIVGPDPAKIMAHFAKLGRMVLFAKEA